MRHRYVSFAPILVGTVVGMLGDDESLRRNAEKESQTQTHRESSEGERLTQHFPDVNNVNSVCHPCPGTAL